MISRFATLTASIALCSMFGAATMSHAGVMPDTSGHTAQKEHVSTLDEALMEIQGKTEESQENMAPPVSLTETPVEPVTAEPPKMDPIAEEKPAEPAPAPKMVEEPKTVFDPVPESRFVETQPNSSFFGLSVGLYDAFSRDETAAAFNIEWQPGVKIAGFIQPIFGAMITTQGSMMGYGGAGIPFNITENVILMPSAAVGLYEEGDGKDLGQSVAYRFGTELAYQFENKSRIGLNAHIITNGESLDSDDRTEVISVVYTTPLGQLNQ